MSQPGHQGGRFVFGSVAGDEPSVFPTGWARRLPVRAVREAVQQAIVRPVLHAELSIDVHGLDAIAGLESPAIWVANHSSHLDAALILTTLPAQLRRTTAVAAADYFFGSWWRAGSSAVAFNSFPIERSLPSTEEQALDTATRRATSPSTTSLRAANGATTPARLLAEGWNVILFPEGTRSPDGFLGEFSAAAAELAIAHQVPVVPVGLRGSYAAMPRGRSWPAPGRPRVSVRYGKPVRARSDEPPADLSCRLAVGVQRLIDEDRGTWWQVQRDSYGAPGEATFADSPTASWRRIWQQSAEPMPGGQSTERPIWH